MRIHKKTKNAIEKNINEKILLALHNQRSSIKPNPYIIIKNLPIDTKIFSTPHLNCRKTKCKSGDISENLLIGISSLIGEPYSVEFEGKDIANNLVPIKEHKNLYTGLGSKAELDFHIENAALKSLGKKISPL